MNLEYLSSERPYDRPTAQISILNLCCAIEQAANCIVGKRCIFWLFTEPSQETLLALAGPEMSQERLDDILGAEHKLGFGEVVAFALKIYPDIHSPLSAETLRQIRNQCIHGVLLGFEWMRELVALAAYRICQYLSDRDIAPTSIEIDEPHLKRLGEYEKHFSERHKAIGDKLAKAQRTRKKNKVLQLSKGTLQQHEALVTCPICSNEALLKGRFKGRREYGYPILGVQKPYRVSVTPISFQCVVCELAVGPEEMGISRLDFFRFIELPSGLGVPRESYLPVISDTCQGHCKSTGERCKRKVPEGQRFCYQH